jgi:hypothetical protein
MEPADFNLRHLRALAATLRLGSLGAAAKAVGISQPAVTQAIARLEELTGTRLLDRGRRNCRDRRRHPPRGARRGGGRGACGGARTQRRGGIGARAGADAELSMAQAVGAARAGRQRQLRGRRREPWALRSPRSIGRSARWRSCAGCR